ncbi:retron Ec48 family effector membrane protein [Burkholderia ubonensis]|uniref:retron Ec48 family effector membrane protein n=1 Tax=Burkholderia ubonensis TaxID=101571 RepID=UPI000B330852|nr:retron Ec48 family effector membrane protein [Burkholderia ubonensis]
MNRLVKFYRWHPSIAILATIIFVELIGGVVLSVAVLVATSREMKLFAMSLCFSNKCVHSYFDDIAQSLLIFKATLDVAVAISTVGGIFVALLSYFSSASNYALANHIEHLKVFREYLEAEIRRRDRLAVEAFDSLLWYGKIFAESRNGKTQVSGEYVGFIKSLNEIICESNQRSVVGTPGGFSYRDHQRKIRDHLFEIGIVVYIAPRNDYFEMEDQLFSLIHRIGQSFCSPGSVAEITKRQYH